MSKYPLRLTIILLSLLCLIITGLGASAANPPNGDFEAGTVADWAVTSITGSGSSWDVVSTQHYGGSYSLWLNGKSNAYTRVRMSTGMSFTNGDIISFYVKGDYAPNSGIQIRLVNTAGLERSAPSQFLGSGGNVGSSWTIYNYTVIGNCADGRIEFKVVHTTTTEWFNQYIDNIMVNGQPYAPVAAFTPSVVSGASPLEVTFTDTSLNSPTAWFWDFGDGVNSTAQNPVHLYNVPGVYNVSLLASNAAGYDYENRSGYIIVGAQAGSVSGYFRLTGSYDLSGGFSTEGFAAQIIESDPYDLYDGIVWYLDGAAVPDGDVPFYTSYKEVKNVTGSWKSYNPVTYGWDDPGLSAGWQLLNVLHPHYSGNHIIGAKIYYSGVLLASLSLTVNFHDAGELSGNYVSVVNGVGALLSNSWVNRTELATGINSNTSLPAGTKWTEGVRGHMYRFTITSPGYTTLIEDREWPETTNYDPIKFVLVNSSKLPSDGDQVFLNVRVRNIRNHAPLPGALIQVDCPGQSSQYWTANSEGFIAIAVPKNSYIEWYAWANYDLTMFPKVTGYINTGTDNYPLDIYLTPGTPTSTPTSTPYVPTAVPTLPGGGAYPDYPDYNDAERNNIINGGIDEWIGNLPALIELIILVCFITLIGMIGTAGTGKRKR